MAHRLGCIPGLMMETGQASSAAAHPPLYPTEAAFASSGLRLFGLDFLFVKEDSHPGAQGLEC